MHADMLTTAIQHPMCHAKSWRAVGRLFHVFSIEVFLMKLFVENFAVEKCAAGKRMNRRRHKFFLFINKASRPNFYGLKPVVMNRNFLRAVFAANFHKYLTPMKAPSIKG